MAVPEAWKLCDSGMPETQRFFEVAGFCVACGEVPDAAHLLVSIADTGREFAGCRELREAGGDLAEVEIDCAQRGQRVGFDTGRTGVPTRLDGCGCPATGFGESSAIHEESGHAGQDPGALGRRRRLWHQFVSPNDRVHGAVAVTDR